MKINIVAHYQIKRFWTTLFVKNIVFLKKKTFQNHLHVVTVWLTKIYPAVNFYGKHWNLTASCVIFNELHDKSTFYIFYTNSSYLNSHKSFEI